MLSFSFTLKVYLAALIVSDLQQQPQSFSAGQLSNPSSEPCSDAQHNSLRRAANTGKAPAERSGCRMVQLLVLNVKEFDKGKGAQTSI
jgi:hypothetical protein